MQTNAPRVPSKQSYCSSAPRKAQLFFAMILLSSSIVSSIFFVDVKLIDEFISLEKSTDDSDIAADTVFLTDGPDFIGSERRIDPREPTRKFRGMFGSGNIPKWLGIATEKVVTSCLV
jgi:hypothetical protein